MSASAALPRAAGRPLLPWLGFAALAAVAVLGWRATWFLCDDAYITFRHAANLVAGHGLCWNAPPFLPVEGTTSFLWAMLLGGVWAATGVEPPAAANVLSLLFGLMTLGLCARLGARLLVGAPRHRLAVAVCLLAIAGNRTFATWLSSGLETAAFQFFLLWWCDRALVAPARRDARWLLAFALAASLAALTRPDGVLCVLATAVVACQRLREGPQRRALLLAAGALLLVPSQMLWRHGFYGEWLPNTYYAKVTSAWPEAGWRYLVCFLVEHGTWLPLLLLPLFALRSRSRRRPAGGRRPATVLAQQLPAVAAATTLAVQTCYYVLRIGGDHFEYRVLAPWVPLQALGVASLATRLRPATGSALALLFLLASSFGWAHRAWTGPEQPYMSQQAPPPLRPLLRHFDALQAWLQLRRVCVRADYHALFAERVAAATPPPAPGTLDAAGLPLLATSSVGIVGWVLKDAWVIDTFGLCDWVVARTPVQEPGEAERAAAAAALQQSFDRDGSGFVERADFQALMDEFGHFVRHRLITDELTWRTLLMLHDDDDDGRLAPGEAAAAIATLLPQRMMAHERRPPPGYVESFRPNIGLVDGRLRVDPRAVPLTAADVQRLEQQWRAWILDPSRPVPR